MRFFVSHFWGFIWCFGSGGWTSWTRSTPNCSQNALSQPAPVVVAYKNTDGRHGMLEKSLQRWITKNKVSIKTWCHWDHCFALMLLWGLNTWHFDPSGSPKIFKGCYVTSCLTRMKQMKIVTKKYCFWSKTNCWEIVFNILIYINTYIISIHYTPLYTVHIISKVYD